MVLVIPCKLDIELIKFEAWLSSGTLDRSAVHPGGRELLGRRVAGRRIAVIIGVNSTVPAAGLPPLLFAEKDARAVRDLLCDPEIGTFDPADVSLHLGPDAAVGAVKASLSQAVHGAGRDDVLLVFFAGHTREPDWSRGTDVHLVTPDLDDSALALDPEAGLRMSYLKRHVLGRFPGTALLILDCCRAGSLLATTEQNIDLISHDGRPEARYSALMACAGDGTTREDAELGHGVLTYHVLRGLRGQAVDRRGQVTFQAMTNYVQEQGLDSRPGVVTKSWGGTTVLTRPETDASGVGQAPASAIPGVSVTPLKNPLEQYAADILTLIDGISHAAAKPHPLGLSEPLRANVQHVQSATDADSVALLEYAHESFQIVDATPRFDLDDLRHLLQPAEEGLRPDWFGHTIERNGLTLLCAPVNRAAGKVLFLVAVNPRPELVAAGQPVAKVLETVWRADFARHPLEAEVLALTALRETFGRLPTSMFERCFRQYQEIVRSMEIVFQPVVTIGPTPQQVGVHSYEALARRSLDDMRAPAAMLQVPDAWTDCFTIARDQIITEKAMMAYARAHAEDPWDMPKPLSVNVSVRALLSDSYVETLRAAIAAANLDPSSVTLEISERDPIEPRIDEQWPDEPHAYFHNRLVEIARDVGVGFAVDDFGSAYASLSRMAELPLTQIKVDRAILHHRQALLELSFVVAMARDALDRGETHAPRVVIVEGVDEHSPVTLRQLAEKKIRHVQGYIVGEPASARLRRLPLEIRKEIAARVTGDDEPRAIELARRSAAGDGPSLRRGA
ncbi:EAL domain-containing protein [Actinoplanes sp. NPDC049265]|uniref:EAL domain-containing protein n=1 Tax=Actinoplanes sp. NPDC049265 TaxID=3363902 RepID=UPI0037200DE2